MIQTVLFQQEEIWKAFTYNSWPNFWPDGEEGRFKPPSGEDELADTWREIARPQAQFPKYRRRLEKLDEDAACVERHILVQLDLKQKHAAIQETHTATIMSAAIVGFTVITIIFVPLSFLTSLFAIPLDQLQQNERGKYTTSYIGRWMAVGEIASLAVTAVAIWLACEYFLELRVIRLILSSVPTPSSWLSMHFVKRCYTIWNGLLACKVAIGRTWLAWSSSQPTHSALSSASSVFRASSCGTLDIRSSLQTASMRSNSPDGRHETMEQDSRRNRGNFLQGLAKKRRFWRSRREKGSNPDLESGQQIALEERLSTH